MDTDSDKVRLIKGADIRYIVAFILFIAWILLMVYAGQPFSSTHPFNNNMFFVGIPFLAFGILSLWSWERLLNISRRIFSYGFHDTWNGLDLGHVTAPLRDGRPIAPPYLVLPRKSISARTFITRGGGRHGYYMVKDTPGVVRRVGHDLELNVLEWKIAVTPEEKRKLGWIYSGLREAVQPTIWTFDENAPVWVGEIPSPDIKVRRIETDVYNNLVDNARLQQYYLDKVDSLEEEISNIRQKKQLEDEAFDPRKTVYNPQPTQYNRPPYGGDMNGQ